MNKLITKITATVLFLALAATAHACGSAGNRGDKWMFWMYDKQTSFYYADDFVGEGQFSARLSDGGVQMTSTIEHRDGNVKATINVTLPSGERKTYSLTGKIYAMYRCLNSPGRVSWEQREFQDYDALPPGVRSAIQDYQNKM